MIQQAGGEAILLPLMEIRDPSNPEDLEKQIARLPTYDMAIFISPTSAERGLKHVLAHGTWPENLIVAAIGQGTARKLAAYGLESILAPAGRADSEALLALTEMHHVSGKRIVIFRGEGGREVLANSLRQRGAEVEYAECYRRAKPESLHSPVLGSHQLDSLDGIIITSSEGLNNLVELAAGKWLMSIKTTPMFVPHERIAHAARQKGMTKVVITESGDAGMLQGMVKFFQS